MYDASATETITPGEEVTVGGEEAGRSIRGDAVITCIGDKEFGFVNKPTCDDFPGTEILGCCLRVLCEGEMLLGFAEKF